MPDEVFDKDYWDAKYRDRHHLWSGDPNPQLVAEATGLAPTTALDVGCGEGADAIWLARRGWTVTAVDLASTALQRAAVHAQEAGGEIAARIEWREEDVTSWIAEPGRFGLVSAQFLHFPAQERAVLFGRLAAAVAPGGTLLLVGHMSRTCRRRSRGRRWPSCTSPPRRSRRSSTPTRGAPSARPGHGRPPTLTATR